MRSSAVGDLNDFNSYFSNFENPIIQLNERALLPFDAPNRFLFWGDFHIKYGIRLAPVLERRNGFPFSIVDENRNFVGPRDRAGRFSNIRFSRLAGDEGYPCPRKVEEVPCGVGLKVFNVTNHFNPRDFQNNLASDDFGTFSNGVGRKFGTRIVFTKRFSKLCGFAGRLFSHWRT